MPLHQLSVIVVAGLLPLLAMFLLAMPLLEMLPDALFHLPL